MKKFIARSVAAWQPLGLSPGFRSYHITAMLLALRLTNLWGSECGFEWHLVIHGLDFI